VVNSDRSSSTFDKVFGQSAWSGHVVVVGRSTHASAYIFERPFSSLPGKPGLAQGIRASQSRPYPEHPRGTVLNSLYAKDMRAVVGKKPNRLISTWEMECGAGE